MPKLENEREVLEVICDRVSSQKSNNRILQIALKLAFQIRLKIVHSRVDNPIRVSEEFAVDSSLLVEQKLV